MKCIRPIDIRNKKNPHLGVLTVPCGKCAACLTNKRTEWTFRLQQELKVASTAKFITITYDENTIPHTSYGEQELNKKDIQLFIKSIRNEQKRCNNQSQIRYYMVGEYGTETDRPHYHILLFNADASFYDLTPKLTTKLTETWKKGHLDIGTCTLASIHYVTKYVITKNEKEHGNRQKPFSLMSRRPAIGQNYLKANKKYHKDNLRFYVNSPNGTKQGLPRYYKDKIFTDEEKTIQSNKGNAETARIFAEKICNTRKRGLEPYKYIEQQEKNFEKKALKTDKTYKL